MEGHVFLEGSISPETGYAPWESTGMDAMGEFQVKMEIDYAAEALDKARKEAQERNSQVPGERMRVVRRSGN
jgi:hypothetical protein